MPYLCLSLRKWEDIAIKVNVPFPVELQAPEYGSIGILEVFDDLDKLKETYPNSDFVEITLQEKTPVNLN
jgi:hypothetical protein